MLVPVVLAPLVSGGGNYWLWKERVRLSGEAFTATAKLAAVDAVQKETAEKLANLEAERAALVEAKELAVKDAQAKATELAKLKDDVAGVAGVAEDKEPEGAGKDSEGQGGRQAGEGCDREGQEGRRKGEGQGEEEGGVAQEGKLRIREAVRRSRALTVATFVSRAAGDAARRPAHGLIFKHFRGTAVAARTRS